MIYLDNSATTSVSERAAKAAFEMMTENYGNPSSTHALGVKAALALENARKQVAAAIGCTPDTLYFTPSGTAANNTAIFGAAQRLRRRGKRIVTSSIEHPAVENCLERLERDGFEIVRLPVSSDGNISADDIKNAITPDTILVTCMYVNNETGIINNIKYISKITRKQAPGALIHCDAVQAFGKLRVSPVNLDVDMLTVSAHKIHGPKGVGALYIRKGVGIEPYILGGGQEKGMISGTEALPAIVGFGVAASEIPAIGISFPQVEALKDKIVEFLSTEPRIKMNSPDDALPYVVNLSIPGVPSEVTVNFLSENGICISAGSACKKGHRSDVLKSLGLPPEYIDSAIRISFGTQNTPEEVDILCKKLTEACDRFLR